MKVFHCVFFNNNSATIQDAALTGLVNDSANQVDIIDNDTIKEENEEEQKQKREEEIKLLEKAATFLRRKLGTDDILDGELNDFQEILDDGEDVCEEFANQHPQPNISSHELTENGRTFDPLSGYKDFVIAVSCLLLF